jgi:hypothetical protein
MKQPIGNRRRRTVDIIAALRDTSAPGFFAVSQKKRLRDCPIEDRAACHVQLWSTRSARSRVGNKRPSSFQSSTLLSTASSRGWRQQAREGKVPSNRTTFGAASCSYQHTFSPGRRFKGHIMVFS